MSAQSDFLLTGWWQRCQQLATATLLAVVLLACTMTLLTRAESYSVLTLRTVPTAGADSACPSVGVRLDVSRQTYRVEACWQIRQWQLRYLYSGVWTFATKNLRNLSPAGAWSAPSLLSENTEYDELDS